MKNIIFDVGNVLIKWDPINIIKQAFPECTDPKNHLNLFKDIILDLDSGIIDFTLAKQRLQEKLTTTKEKIENLFDIFLSSLIILPESINLLNTLANNTTLSLYCLTNMSRECFIYLNKKYTFWDKFKGIVVSADIKLIKPDPKIYSHILNEFNLIPKETVFIDDILENITTAKNMGIYGIHFTDLSICKNELKKLGVIE
jgi:putative hydrolase of the HAD superfamily